MEIFKLSGLPLEFYGAAGGKAKGLAELIKCGLEVADGFVVIDLIDESDYEKAADYFMSSGIACAAVRSSATNEDGAELSNAGQFSTVLNVSGRAEFIDALKNCMDSLKNITAGAYSKFFNIESHKAKMSIVVQQMVDALYAGVCFTQNPVTGSNSVLIEAVEGLGESLVSGQAMAEHYEIERGGEYSGDGKIVPAKIVNRICAESLRAVDYFKCELDTEWAVDKSGKLVWLQARPITTLDEATVDEFDASVKERDVVTNCNIGEMLPGAVTPLSLSTTVLCIDKGLRRMLIKSGAYKKREIKTGECIISYSNHLFFNLNKIYKMAATMIAARKGDVEMSICGKKLDTPPLEWKNRNSITRAINGIKYFRFLLSRNKAKKKIAAITESFTIPYSENAAEFYKNIEAAIAVLDETMYLHYVTSSHSGAMSSTLLTILTKDFDDETEARATVAGLLEDIDGIESVDILRSMRKIGQRALEKDPRSKDFTPVELTEFIENDDGELKAAYESFLARHGHRAIREAELRSRAWRSDKPALMENLLTVMQSGAREQAKTASNLNECRERVLKNKKKLGKAALNYLINQARQGVANREFTKSKFVLAVDKFKDAYARLADDLVKMEALPDADLIYFLTHRELGSLINERKSSLIKRAVQRRRLLEVQKEYKYRDVYLGNPVPVKAEALQSEDGMVLSGAPISRGEVKGVARVVKSVEDAKMLKDGEIMVAPFTDIGWSPYYSVIGGLITEVGSALSHGAVVAREYALPLVVNVAGATGIIKTGDYISMNCNSGEITILKAKA